MSTTQGNLASPRDIVNVDIEPDHLLVLVLVHGILVSPSDWTYFEAELKRRLEKKISDLWSIVTCLLCAAISSNMYTKTFAGIDGAGKRLADEVTQVVKRTESLKNISFLARSLGGLFARYAVAVLYVPNISYMSDEMASSTDTNIKTFFSSNKASISSGCVPILEKLAAPIAPIFTGRTGSQLFLTDGKPNKPPLLL